MHERSKANNEGRRKRALEYTLIRGLVLASLALIDMLAPYANSGVNVRMNEEAIMVVLKGNYVSAEAYNTEWLRCLGEKGVNFSGPNPFVEFDRVNAENEIHTLCIGK